MNRNSQNSFKSFQIGDRIEYNGKEYIVENKWYYARNKCYRYTIGDRDTVIIGLGDDKFKKL